MSAAHHHVRLSPSIRSYLAAAIVALATACTASGAPAQPTAAPGSPAASPVARANASPGIPGLPPGVRLEVITPTPDESPPPPGSLKLVLQPGTQARYRAQEMLLGRTYMSEAVGTTEQVEGVVYAAPGGRLLPQASRITVGLQGLKSDEERRDAYIKEVTLDTDRFPYATFVPRTSDGLPRQITDDTGPVSFRLSGDLTIRETTRPATWFVNGNVSGDTFTGTAATAVNMNEFGITPPRVPIVIGVDETVRLELLFTFRRERE